MVKFCQGQVSQVKSDRKFSTKKTKQSLDTCQHQFNWFDFRRPRGSVNSTEQEEKMKQSICNNWFKYLRCVWLSSTAHAQHWFNIGLIFVWLTKTKQHSSYSATFIWNSSRMIIMKKGTKEKSFPGSGKVLTWIQISSGSQLVVEPTVVCKINKYMICS